MYRPDNILPSTYANTRLSHHAALTSVGQVLTPTYLGIERRECQFRKREVTMKELHTA